MKTNLVRCKISCFNMPVFIIAIFLFFLSTSTVGQTPTMQVACNSSTRDFYTNLAYTCRWCFTGSPGGGYWGGNIGADNMINYKGQSTPMPVLSDGSNYPTHSPISLIDGSLAYPYMPVSLPFNGTYTVIVDGSGKLEIFGAASNSYTFTNGTTFTFVATGITPPINSGYPAVTGSGGGGYGTINIRISSSDAANPVRNIRVLPPDYTDIKGVVHHYSQTYNTTDVFQKKFLEDMQKYSCIRFMDNLQTNGSVVQYFSQTGQPGGVSAKCTPYLDLIKLCNAANKDLWICIPHLATNGFADTVATLIKNNLNIGLKAYIEYSNEVWNGSFVQSGWANQQGLALGYSSPTAMFYARRSAQIFQRFNNIFTADRNRIILVCAWQMGGYNLGYYNDPIINSGGVKPDVLAVAPYFGKVYLATDIGVVGNCDYQTCAACNATNVPSVQTIENDLMASIKTFVGPSLRQSKASAAKYNLPLINYEGGYASQGMYGAENSCVLTDNECQVNRSSQMYGIQRQWMDSVKAAGSQMLNQYVDCGGWSKWGWWGLEEFRGQDMASPKLKALVEWENDNPTILDTQAPSQSGTPVKTNAKATSIDISWTPSTDNGTILGYDIFVNGIFKGSSNCQIINTNYSITGLNPNTSYSITVKARDFGGNYSPASNALVVSTLSSDTQKPTTVVNLKCTGKNSNSINLSWNASTDNDRVAQYIIYWGSSMDSTLNLSYSIQGLSANTSYTCTVRAKDPSGNLSDPSYLVISTDLLPIVVGKQTFASVNIDGNLDEADWKLAYSFNHPVSITDVPDNDSHNFGILWDANYLYIGAKALDNVVYKNGAFYNGDGFEFEIDGNHNHSTTLEAGHDVKYTIQWNNNAINGADTIGVLHKFQNIPGGWSCEVAIPWSKLGISAPTVGASVGFDVIYDDNDGISYARSRQVAFTGDQSIWSSCAQFGDLIFATDNAPPTAPTNISASNITFGSATITWSPSTDASGIKGYNVYVNNVLANNDNITGNSYVVTGLSGNTQYSISVIAKDNNDNVSTAGTCQFTTLAGNMLVNFDATTNSIKQFTCLKSWTKNATNFIIPFSTATGSELYNPTGLSNQYQIKGGFSYDCSPNAPTNTNTPIMQNTQQTWSNCGGSLYLYTGEYFAAYFTGILMWTKDKFLNGNASYSNLIFDNTANSTLVLKLKTDNLGTIRFIVKADGIYYISESVYPAGQAANTSYTLSGFGNNSNENQRWTVYDPTTLVMPPANAMNFSAVNFNNVQEVGCIFSVGRPMYSYSFGLIQFSAYGVQSTADGQAPTAPTNLTASNVVSTSFSLSWTASTDNVGVTSYEVFKNGTSAGTTTATSMSFSSLSENTSYNMTVKAKDAAGNISTLSQALSVKTPALISGMEENKDIINIYPNPANNWITVETNSDNQTLTITDLQGKLILTKSITGSINKLNLSSLKQGIYILEVRSDKYIQFKKLIIK